MPVIDPGSIGGILADLGVSLLSYAGIALILYSIGGILIRTVSWVLDKQIIELIERFYEYFEQILKGTLFTESIVEGMLNRVYLIIGVILIFRLAILLIQYIMNPAEVLEEKGGVNSLVKRAIIGLILMVFIPTIFEIANDLSAAILSDQVIEKIIMDDKTLTEIEKMKAKYGTGKVIGTTIFQGFWNIDKNQVTDKNIIKAYEDAEKKMDPGLVDDAGYGILTESGGKYVYDYFPILSTVVLAYVLYLVIKYCLDMVVRLLKLLVLQVIAPITIVEYIINSDRNEVFKKWRTSVIANYAMLFIRVFTIWFTVWVTYLMRNGVAGESLLNSQDYLLKAIIILGLLAFMIDFPKMMSDIFGLDLEQDSAVKGVLGKAMGGMVAGLAVGGAVAGFGMKAAGGISSAAKGGLHNISRGTSFKDKLSDFGKGFKKTAIAGNLGSTLKGGLMGVGVAAMNSNSATSSIYKGYTGTTGSINNENKKQEEKATKNTNELTDMVKTQAQNNPNASKEQIIESVLNTKINGKLDSVDVSTITANIKGILDGLSESGKPISPKTVTQLVQQQLGNQLDVSPKTTQLIVEKVMGSDNVSTSVESIDQVVNQVINEAKSGMTKEVTQVVNQVMGTVADTTVSDVDQTVNQKEGTKVDMKVDDTTQKINQEKGSEIDTEVDDATQKINQEKGSDESLIDDEIIRKVVKKADNGEAETLFGSDHIDG